MSTDWNPVVVEQALWKIKEDIARGVLIVDEAYGEFDEADEEFVLAEARAYTEEFKDTPAHERKYHVALAVAKERQKRRIAERKYKKAISTMQSLRNGLDAVRSIGTGVREAYKLAGVGER